MGELGVNMIPAGSPQAKGRIERLWGTLQDRLVQEFILNGIKDVESANKFMEKYIVKFNSRFSVTPKGSSAFRKLDSGSAFSYRGKYFQLISGGKPATTIPQSSIKVMISKRIGIMASYCGRVYNVVILETRPKVSVDIKIDKKLISRKSAAGHPWKSGKSSGFKYDLRDEEISRGLFNLAIAWETDSY